MPRSKEKSSPSDGFTPRLARWEKRSLSHYSEGGANATT